MDFSFQTFLYLVLGAAAAWVFVKGGSGTRDGFFFSIGTLALGYRTLHVTSHLSIHPAEVLLWATFLLMAVSRESSPSKGALPRLPGWVKVFWVFWLWGLLLGWEYERPWDVMFSEFKNFLVLVPLFLVARNVLADRRAWAATQWVFFGTGTLVGFLGVLEYAFPDLVEAIPGFAANPYASPELGGFERATFSFYGAPVATFMLVMTAPLAVSLWRSRPHPYLKPGILVAVFFQLAGIYVGGHRSMWLILMVQAAVWVLLYYGPAMSLLSLVPSFLVYTYVPETATERFLTLVSALQGNVVDSSAENRWNMAAGAWNTALEFPWGLGWGGAGWPHNDYLQVAVNMGMVAGAWFLVTSVVTLYRLWRMQGFRTKKDPDPLALALLLAFIGALGILASQGVQRLAQLVMPVWVVWVLVEIWFEQRKQEETV